MIKGGSLYYASDKALFDALCQHKMSKSSLQELFWTRGIIKSNKLEKEDIAKYFSRLNHDYFDHKFISEVISSGSHKERQRSVFAYANLSIDKLEKSVKELIAERKEIDNSIDFNSHKESINIEVSYSYHDYRKPEFKQLVTKNAVISIEKTADGINIRAPDNSYIEEITTSLILKITQNSSDDVDLETINLFGVDSVKLKIEFFEKLIAGLDELELYDVSFVSVYNPDTGDADELGVHVRKASLNGEGILKSGELKQFYTKGFFVHKIFWSMTEIGNPKSDIFNFQAQFNDPATCQKFAYISKGFRRYVGEREHTKETFPLSTFEEARMMRKLEKSARNAKKAIFNTGNGEVDESEK